MKTRVYFWILLLGTALVLTACSSSVNSASLARVSPGMKVDQVENLLGRPTHIDQSEITGITGKVYIYSSKSGEARVVFINDSAFKTEFIPEGNHA